MKRMLFASICAIFATVACGTTNVVIPTLDSNQLQTVIVSTALAAKNQTKTAATIPNGTPIPTNTNLPIETPAVISTEIVGLPNTNCMSALDYRPLVSQYTGVISNDFDKYDQLTQQDVQNSSLIFDETWIANMNTVLLDIKSNAQAFLMLKPPKIYVAFNDEANQSMKDLIIFVNLEYLGINQHNSQDLQQAQIYLNKSRTEEDTANTLTPIINLYDNTCP